MAVVFSNADISLSSNYRTVTDRAVWLVLLLEHLGVVLAQTLRFIVLSALRQMPGQCIMSGHDQFLRHVSYSLTVT